MYVGRFLGINPASISVKERLLSSIQSYT